jgi:single-strand DNA-binding protein
MLNRVILIGRLARDPELRYTGNAIAVTTFAIAVDRPFTSASGEREADFIDIVVWRKLAETCANHLNKGRLVAVEGRMQTRSYDDSNGVRRKVTEVVADNVRFLDRPKEGKGSSVEQGSNAGGSDRGEAGGYNDDIDVPF